MTLAPSRPQPATTTARRVAPALLWMLLSWLILLPGGASADSPRVIRLASPDVTTGQQPSSGTPMVDRLYLQRLLEQEFAHDGITIRWAFFKNAGPAINEAIANDQVDFAFLGDLAGLIGESVGNRTRLLAASARGINGYLGVAPGSGHQDLESLRGKTIGVWMGTASQLALEATLARHGYSRQDFRLISLDASALMAALAARRVDAIWTTAGLLVLEARQLAELPVTTRNSQGIGTLATLVLGSSRFVERYPEITARVVRLAVEAAYWGSDPAHSDEVITLLAERTGLPPALWQRELQYGLSLAERNSPLLDDFLVGHLRHGAEAALAAGLIRRPVDVDAWLEPRFLHQALQALALENHWPEQPAYDNPWSTGSTAPGNHHRLQPGSNPQ